MTKTLRRLALALLATGLLAGCGNEVERANDAIDKTQERVDRAREAAKDPAGAAKREADRALEDAISPEEQP